MPTTSTLPKRRPGRPATTAPDEYEQLNVRMPKVLIAWLRSQAAVERRSLAGQTVYLLERAMHAG